MSLFLADIVFQAGVVPRSVPANLRRARSGAWSRARASRRRERTASDPPVATRGSAGPLGGSWKAAGVPVRTGAGAFHACRPPSGLGRESRPVALRATERGARRRDIRGRALSHGPEEMPAARAQRSPRRAGRRESEPLPGHESGATARWPVIERCRTGRIEARVGVSRVWLAEVGRTHSWWFVREHELPDPKGAVPLPIDVGTAARRVNRMRVCRAGAHEAPAQRAVFVMSTRSKVSWSDEAALLIGGWISEGLALRVAALVATRELASFPPGGTGGRCPERDRGRQPLGASLGMPPTAAGDGEQPRPPPPPPRERRGPGGHQAATRCVFVKGSDPRRRTFVIS